MSERRSGESSRPSPWSRLDLAADRATRPARRAPAAAAAHRRTASHRCRRRPGLLLGVMTGPTRPATTICARHRRLVPAAVHRRADRGRGRGRRRAARRRRAQPSCSTSRDRARAARRPARPGWSAQAEQRNGGPLADDVAMLLVTPGRWPMSRTVAVDPARRVTALLRRRRRALLVAGRGQRDRGGQQPQPTRRVLDQTGPLRWSTPSELLTALLDQQTGVRGLRGDRQRADLAPYHDGPAAGAATLPPRWTRWRDDDPAIASCSTPCDAAWPTAAATAASPSR